MFLQKLAAAGLALFLSAAAFGQALPQGVQKKASAGGITEYAFSNGLRVLLYPDPSNPKVTVDVTYLVGSRHEGYGESGMAHLLEHMNFIETTNGRQIKKEIVDHGAAWNGTTSYDRTNYFETVPATDDNLKWALGLEADRMVRVKFTKQILDTEMTVVRNEFERGENSPQSVLRERVASTAYLWHNYGKDTIGSKADLERVPMDRLEAFYKKYYQPDNAVLVITGRIDEGRALAAVAETMGRLPRPARKLDQTYTVEPPQDGERYIELRRVGEGQQVIVAYHTPAAAHPDSAALQVLAGIMSGGGGRGGRGGGAGEGRLSKALVDNRLATSVSMQVELLHDPGLAVLSASLTQDQSLDAAKKALISTLEGIVKEPPTTEEIDRVKTGLLRNLERSLSDPQSLATGPLNTAIAQGDWRLLFLQHDRLGTVTTGDVVRVAKAYFKPSNRTIGCYIPDAAPDRTVVPGAPDLETTFRGYTSPIAISRGESFDPSPANIESRVVRSKLSNGMKLVLLPKKTAADMVTATVELRFGDERTLIGKSPAAQMAGSLLMMGTKSKSRQKLQDEMRKLDASILATGGGGFGGGRGGRGGFTPAGGLSTATAGITVPAKNFPAALRLAVEMLKEPAYPEDDFDRILRQRIKGLELAPTEPGQLASDALTRHLSSWAAGDALYTPERPDQLAALKRLTIADVRAFHDQFYGANFGVLGVIGPVDPAEVKRAAEELLGSWNTRTPYRPIPSSFKAVQAVNRKIETPDKANAQFEAGLRFRMSDTDPDYPAMVLAGYMFGGPITSRVSDRIRNREGLSYGANARVTVPAEGDAALLSGTVSLNPGNGPKVEASFTGELARTLKEGFTGKEVADAKQAYLNSRIVNGAQDASLVAQLVAHEQLGRTMTWDEQLEKKIAALTPDQVNAAFRRHIDAAAVSIVKAGDFRSAGVY